MRELNKTIEQLKNEKVALQKKLTELSNFVQVRLYQPLGEVLHNNEICFFLLLNYGKSGQLAARVPNVVCHSVFRVPRKHSGNIFKSEISSNLSQ